MPSRAQGVDVRRPPGENESGLSRVVGPGPVWRRGPQSRVSEGSSLTQFSKFRVFVLGTAALIAAAGSASAQDGGEAISLKSVADGKTIAGSYYAPRGGGAAESEDAPVVILIHGETDDRLVWERKPTSVDGKPAADVLSGAGFAVVTIDMRGYGESKEAGSRRPNPNAMLGDLEAVKQFLMEKHEKKELNINKLGIVAAGDFAPIAAAYAEYDWKKPDYDDALSPAERTPRGRDVQALVLLSPAAAVGRTKTGTALRTLTDPRAGVGVFIINGSDDPRNRGVASDLGRTIQHDKDPQDNKYFHEYETAFHGTDLVGQRGLMTEREMFGFLSKYLKDLDKPWVDRRSKLSR